MRTIVNLVVCAVLVVGVAGCGKGTPTSPTSPVVTGPTGPITVVEPLPVVRTVAGVTFALSGVEVVTIGGGGRMFRCKLSKSEPMPGFQVTLFGTDGRSVALPNSDPDGRSGIPIGDMIPDRIVISHDGGENAPPIMLAH